MTTESELIALAERVESATGADRELDYAIHENIHGDWLRRNAYIREQGDDGWYSATPPIKGANSIAAPQAYTASLDAAMTLVPKGCLHMARTIWDAEGKTAGIGCINQYVGDMWTDGFDSCAATPALALTAAALRALAAAQVSA